MSKLRSVLLSGLLLAVSTSSLVAAAAPSFCDTNNTGSYCQQITTAPAGNPVVDTITKTVNILSYLIGVAAVIMILVGSIRYIISNGDQARVKSSKDAVMYAAIGLLVALIAQVLVVFILNKA